MSSPGNVPSQRTNTRGQGLALFSNFNHRIHLFESHGTTDSLPPDAVNAFEGPSDMLIIKPQTAGTMNEARCKRHSNA